MEMYAATMTNSEADSFYYFSIDFYNQLIDNLGEQLICTKTMKDGIIYGIALFFHSDHILTYYLSARNLNYTKVPSTNFILSKMSSWATMNNVKTFNLGGGLSMNPDDRLFKFKTNFSKNTMPFYIGKRVHLKEIYENIKKEWIVKNGIEEFDKVRNVLQFYRL
jgi:lipid II:glycine glycyltransferase (peptidoglycan interpeptide bridge formation enzyme)